MFSSKVGLLSKVEDDDKVEISDIWYDPPIGTNKKKDFWDFFKIFLKLVCYYSINQIFKPVINKNYDK